MSNIISGFERARGVPGKICTMPWGGGGGGGLVNLYKEDKDREEKKKREVFMLQWSNVNSR